MQVGGLPEPIRQIDPDRVAGVDPQRRADVLALIGVALDHRARYGEGCRLHGKRGPQHSVFRLHLDWRLEGAALFSLEGRRYGLIGGPVSRLGRWAARGSSGRCWWSEGWADSDDNGHDDEHNEADDRRGDDQRTCSHTPDPFLRRPSTIGLAITYRSRTGCVIVERGGQQ